MMGIPFESNKSTCRNCHDKIWLNASRLMGSRFAGNTREHTERQSHCVLSILKKLLYISAKALLNLRKYFHNFWEGAFTGNVACEANLNFPFGRFFPTGVKNPCESPIIVKKSSLF